MKPDFSRRNFLTAGLLLPAAGLRTTNNVPLSPEGSQANPESVKLTYRTLGKTGLKVTSLSFGCMTTSDPCDQARGGLGSTFSAGRVYRTATTSEFGAASDVRQKVIISARAGHDQAEVPPICLSAEHRNRTSTSGTCTTGTSQRR
jgi:hypothetical protein